MTTRRHLAVVPSVGAIVQPPAPPSNHNLKYKLFARTFREFKALGSKYEVKAMYTLLDFERTTIAWQERPNMKFDEVLREERFCTTGRYRAFKRALDVFRKPQVERLGISSVCLIAKQPARYHDRLTKAALKFRQTQELEPTYQYVSNLINNMLPRKSSRPTYGQLRDYCEQLKDVIRDLGGKVPKFEEPIE